MSSRKSCSRHSCSKKSDLHKCRYCNESFCKEHKKPFTPHVGLGKSHFRHEGDGGHPCFGYVKHAEKKRKKEKDEEYSAFDALLRGKSMENKTKRHHKPSRNFPPNKKTEEPERDFNDFIDNITPKEKRTEKWNSFPQKPRNQKNIFKKKSHEIKRWLKKREHRRYNFWSSENYVIYTVLIFIISIVAIAVFYTNAQRLNEINFWILKLGGILILVSLFFAIKYGWRTVVELNNFLKRQRNWIKLILFIIVVILLWQAYSNKDTILNPVYDYYNQTNFSLFKPVSFAGLNLSSPDYSEFEDNSDSNNFLSNIGEDLGGNSRDVGAIEDEIFVLVNEERGRVGARLLSSKSNLNSFARSWSEKMISQDFFEHSSLNFQYPNIAGENIAENPIHYNVAGCGSTYSSEAMAKCFVEGWIGSPGHYKNMVDRSFSMTGIGVSCDSSKCRATQVFSG